MQSEREGIADATAACPSRVQTPHPWVPSPMSSAASVSSSQKKADNHTADLTVSAWHWMMITLGLTGCLDSRADAATVFLCNVPH